MWFQAGLCGACLAPHALGWAECSFPGTQTHRNCFQCYFYFAKINSKLLKDPFSRSKLEMAIIPQACGTSCCAELPRALQGISAQAVPSIRQTFTGALLATAEGIAAGTLRFTGSHGGTDVLVWLTKDRVLLAVCPSSTLGQQHPAPFATTAQGAFLTVRALPQSRRHSQG